MIVIRLPSWSLVLGTLALESGWVPIKLGTVFPRLTFPIRLWSKVPEVFIADGPYAAGNLLS